MILFSYYMRNEAVADWYVLQLNVEIPSNIPLKWKLKSHQTIRSWYGCYPLSAYNVYLPHSKIGKSKALCLSEFSHLLITVWWFKWQHMCWIGISVTTIKTTDDDDQEKDIKRKTGQNKIYRIDKYNTYICIWKAHSFVLFGFSSFSIFSPLSYIPSFTWILPSLTTLIYTYIISTYVRCALCWAVKTNIPFSFQSFHMYVT